IAKLAIAQIICECEKRGSLFVDRSKASIAFRENDKVMNSWLEDFFFLLQEHVSRGQLDLLLKNLMIINFNYDRCIEHFLMNAIRRVYQKDESTAAELLKKNLRIVHPYGKLGDLPWQSSSGVNFGGHEYPHPDYLLAMAGGIRTFNEEMRDDESLWRM